MKRIILGALVISAALISCKKDNPTPATCAATVAGIAGNYKITQLLAVTSSGSTDVTTTFFDACKLGGVYQLKSDSTVIYTEAGGACTDSDSGTWTVVANKISASTASFDFADAPVVNNCSNIVITEDIGGGSSFVTTFTKQ